MLNESGVITKFPGMVAPTVPHDLFLYHNDFTEYAAGDWTVTTVEDTSTPCTEAIVADGSLGGYGVIKLSTGDNADGGTQLQGPEIVKLDAGYPLHFSTRVYVTDTGIAEWCIGLATTDTTLIASGVQSTTDFIGFIGGTEAAADAMLFRCEKDGTAVNSSDIDIVDATWYKLDFCWDGVSKVYYYVDNVLKGTHATYIPNNEWLAVSVAVNNSTAATNDLAIDYITVLSQPNRT